MMKLPPLILLSAGRGSRLGTSKGLFLFEGRSWLEHQLERIVSVGIKQVSLVLGFEAEKYVELLSRIPDFNLEITVLINPQPERGMFSSVQVGIESVIQYQRAFLMPIDTPCPAAQVWHELASSKPVAAAIPQFAAHGGHPLLLNQIFMRKLVQENFNSRLDFCIRALDSEDVLRVACGDILSIKNLNTADDFTNFISRR